MVQMDNASCGANEPKICYIKGMDYNFPKKPPRKICSKDTEKNPN